MSALYITRLLADAIIKEINDKEWTKIAAMGKNCYQPTKTPVTKQMLPNALVNRPVNSPYQA